MKCYYEELGVDRDASDGDIKVAYRKLALRWHPDKNPDNLQEAKERFQTLQQAYEVLSDQHERAWYDNHREQILRGKNSDYEENCLDLFQYFTVSCFKGYGDDAKGFYKTYAEVFETIAAEDAEFMEDENDIEEIPKFGDSTSSYDDVVGPFYAYWQSYCTKKTYTWLCPYDITEIKDRRVLREIDKDMKKVVQKARRERNDEVRNLVSFIRKRDKRVQANKKLLEEKAALNRQKQEQNRLEQIRRRNRELEEMRKTNGHAFNDGYEQQLKQLEQEYGEEFESDSEDDQEGESQELNELNKEINFDDDDELQYVDDLYCVACNRAFKNENAFMNHETSKKHKENIERLKREMQDEEKSFAESFDEEEQLTVPPLAEEDDLDELHEDFEGIDVDAEEDVTNKKVKAKKNKKGKKPPRAAVEEEEQQVELHEEIIDLQTNGKDADESDNEWGKGKKPTKKSKNKKPQKKTTAEEPNILQPIQSHIESSFENLPSNNTESNVSSFDVSHICVTCKSTFDSKNKLFAHLKKTNHGVYIPKPKPQPANSQTTKKSKGKRK